MPTQYERTANAVLFVLCRLFSLFSIHYITENFSV